MIKRILMLTLCVVLGGNAIARVVNGALDGPRQTAIDGYVKAELARQRVPGFALAILKRGQPLYVKAYGVANLEHAVPMRPNSLVKTGATGMQLTAAAVLLLVEDGKVELDDSIRKYLPEAPATWQPITIRQLLNHTSGLPATPNGDFRTDYTEAQFLDILYKEALNFQAGTRWRFSYVDYVALGFVIKRVSGEYYADVLETRVFKPLGMKTARPIDELAVIPHRAAGYEMSDGKLINAKWVSQTANSTADGSLYLSLLDFVAWEAGISRQAILKPQTWAEVGKPARLSSGTTYPYGFGWYLEEVAGQQVWRHTGSWQGFQTSIIRFLGDGLTIVALANGEGGSPLSISRRIAAMVNPKLASPPVAAIEDRGSHRAASVRSLLANIAEGKASSGDFTQFADLDFTEMMAMHQGVLAPLGALLDLALVKREALGDDQVDTYRGRYKKGVVDVIVGYAPNGKIGNLEINPVDD